MDFAQLKLTYIENWPAALHALSVAGRPVPLTLEEARALGANIAEWGETFLRTPEEEAQFRRAAREVHAQAARRLLGQDPGEQITLPRPASSTPGLEQVAERVRAALAKLPDGCGFLRLGSRSPKDSWLGHRTGFKACATDDDPLRFFLDCSERIHDDLHLALRESYPPTIWARRWLDLHKWQEWRCFMRGREFLGASQYHYREYLPQCEAHFVTLVRAVHDFFPRFRDACHLDDAVFDLVVRPSPVGAAALLLEVNPFGPDTDPCLFSWSKMDFGGEVRARTFAPEPAVGVESW